MPLFGGLVYKLGRYGMIRAETDTRALLAALKFIDKKAMPDVVSETLNHAASATSKEAQKNAKGRMIIRKGYSIKSIKQDRHAKGENIIKMYSRAAVRAPYMVAQELGLDVNPKPGFKNVPVPTLFSRGDAKEAIILKGFWINKLPEQSNAGSEYQGKGIARFFVGTPKGGGRKEGIWFRHNNNKKLTMIRSLTKNVITKKPMDFFKDAVAKFGTSQFLLAGFSKRAKEAIRKTGLGVK